MVAEPPAREPTAAEPAPYTTEPDHLDPNRSVAKNAAGEVVGKGTTPEEATADAQRRGGAPYEEAPAARPAAEPAAAAPTPETPAKRPVTKEEYEALEKRARAAGAALQRAERDRTTPPERLDTLRQRADEAGAALRNAERPPVKGSWNTSGYDPNLTREQRNQLAKKRQDRETAAAEAHKAAVDRRVHAEGTDPTPEPSKAGAIFRMDAPGDIVRGTDTKGKNWIGTGNALIQPSALKGQALTRAAAAPTRAVTSEALTKVTTPDPKVKYEPVTWDRQVTDPDTGQVLIIGTKADGELVALQKPVYDALHAAAGKDGVIVAGAGKSDDGRMFARTTDAHTGQVAYPGVGMPRRLDPERARVWARGADEHVSEPAKGVPSKEVAEPVAGPGTKSPLRDQLDKLMATRETLNAKARTPAEQRKFQAVEKQIAALERKIAKEEGTPPATRTTEDAASGTVEARGGSRKVPFQGPEPVGRPRNLMDFKFNDGTSVFRSVFEEAGHDPNLAQSYPIDRQVRILAQHQKDLFGFREVRVPGRRGMEPTRVELHQAAEAMLDTTRAFKDGMAAIGLPYEAVSNHGGLALEYVPRGSTNWFGQYVFDGTIKIQSGANAYGHEWTHAIDHMLAERFTNNPANMNKLLSQYARGSGLNTADNVQAAFAKLINTMFYDDVNLATRRLALEVDAQKVDKQGNPTKQALNAQEQLVKLEGAGSKLRIHSSEFRKLSAQFHPPKADYYASVYEMLARSHEAYLSRKMQQQGLDPRGFVMPDEAYVNMVDRQLRMAYPKQAERTAIFDAWDEVHKAMNQEAILSNGKPPGDFADYGMSDPHHWPITAPNTRKTDFAKSLRAEINRYKNLTFRQFRDQMFGIDPTRPPPLPKHTLKTRMADGFRTLAYAHGAMLNVIIKRAPPEAKPILQMLRDRVATDPGSGRVTTETFEERVRDQSEMRIRQYGQILANHGYDPRFPSENMPLEERLMLRHLLVGGSPDKFVPDLTDPTHTVVIPERVRKVHAAVRQMLNQTWGAADEAKLNIGYAKNGYFPRIYDRARAQHDAEGFQTAAREVYSLMFDQEIGAPGADPAALYEKWSTLPRESQELAAKQGNAQLPSQMGELKANLTEQAELRKLANPTSAARAKLIQLEGEAKQLAKDTHGDLRDFIADVNAADWHTRLTGAAIADFDTASSGGRYLNARTLPPEADHIMREFMFQDPHVVLPGYFHSVARRIAQAQLFGPNNEVLTRAVNQLNRVKGMNSQDTEKVETIIKDLIGQTNHGGWSKWLQIPHNAVFAYGTLQTMERAAWSSLTEPMVATMVTKEFTAGFRNMGYWLGHLAGTQNAIDRAILAEFLNVVQSPMADTIMLSRMAPDINDSPGTNSIMSNFFKATGLTQLTNGQRQSSVGVAHWFLSKLAQMHLNTGTDPYSIKSRDTAGLWFRDLGLSDDFHDTFANFLVDMQGKLPTPQELEAANASNRYGGMGDAYSLMMRRLVDRFIQAPHKVDRAMSASVPWVGLAFQLQSFNYAFAKNVLGPAFHDIGHTYHVLQDAYAQQPGVSPGKARAKAALGSAGAAVNTAAAVAALVGMATMSALVRALVYNYDKVKEHWEKGDFWEWIIDLGFSRSGMNGVLDAPLQAQKNIKFDGDLASTTHGAALNTFFQNVQQVLYPDFGKDVGDNTNTARYNQAKAFYNLTAVPLTSLVLSALGAQGPGSRMLAAPAMWWLTSPSAADQFATTVAGPKGQTAWPPRDSGGGGGMPGMPKLPGMPGMPGMPKMGGGGGGAAKKESDGNSMWQMGMGLIDDLIVPASRFIAPTMAMTPAPVKMGAAIAGAGYGAYKYLEATAPYRNNPNPPPKRNN